jgi:hypothetical protein
MTTERPSEPTPHEARLIEKNHAWRARADQDARTIADLRQALGLANDRIRTLEGYSDEFDKLVRDLRWTIKAIGERTAPRPDEAMADGTRVEQ